MLVNYISIKTTIGRFLKEFGLEDTSYVDDIPQWIEDAIEIIGIPNYYVYRYHVSKVTEYKAGLPCDIQNLHGIWVSPDCIKAKNAKSLKRLFLRHSPLFGAGIQTDNGIQTNCHGTAYGSINGGMVHTSFREGYLYIVYKGIPLDCDGYPLVPKDAKVNEALQYYFIYKMGLSGYKHPVIDMKTAYQMWEKTYPAAGNSINWMDLQDLQEFTELWTNVLIGDLHANNYIH